MEPRFGDPRLPERFWAKVSPEPMSGCWLWTGSLTVSGEYGQYSISTSKPVRAHRYAYQVLVAPVSSSLHMDHLCRVRCCVNPAHLEPVTHAENVRRGEAGMKFKAQRLALPFCPNGHEYTSDNTYIDPKRGHRHCRACARAKWARLNARRAA